MLPRLVLSALVFCTLASRPGAAVRRRSPPSALGEARTVAVVPACAPTCAPGPLAHATIGPAPR